MENVCCQSFTFCADKLTRWVGGAVVVAIVKVKVKRYRSSWQVISELRGVTCRMGSRSVTFHPTQVNSPRLTPVRQVGTRFIYPVWMEGWVDLGDFLHTEMVYQPADGHPPKD